MMKYLLGMLFLSLFAHGASAQDYRVRAGDQLQVTVWEDEKLNRSVLVAPDGKISLPLAGRIRASGRTAEEIQAAVRDRLASRFVTPPDVTISVSSLRPDPPLQPKTPDRPLDPSIYVTGEVAKPGQYFYRTRTNVLQAIALAGGLGPFAADSRIRIRRNVNGQDRLLSFNYADFISGTNVSGNITLQSGDVVIVPEKALFE
jgi:polysaccharide biosynthesis/export protein